MAKCRQCQAHQGCSCQLTNGLCPGCYSAFLQQEKDKNDAKSKTN